MLQSLIQAPSTACFKIQNSTWKVLCHWRWDDEFVIQARRRESYAI